ncbi:hypothetical protein TrLO_g499 [Triparma laevis f. longispina]|uniref:ATP-dependent RNA helicase n=1 Tax=Triparma laevis f. longispina TaxID=1714387 RepID=A0A9W7C356_9STRA|nr:hypothetical protein TrLO_g499 [Triparma laevis f. longispina]
MRGIYVIFSVLVTQLAISNAYLTPSIHPVPYSCRIHENKATISFGQKSSIAPHNYSPPNSARLPLQPLRSSVDEEEEDDPVLAALLPLSNDKLKEELKDRGIDAKGSKRKLAELLRDEILAEVEDDDEDDAIEASSSLPEEEFMEPLEEGSEEEYTIEESDNEDNDDDDEPNADATARKSESDFQTSSRLLRDLPPSLKLYFKKSLQTTSLTPIQSQIFDHLYSGIVDAPPFIIHSATGSGKTLGLEAGTKLVVMSELRSEAASWETKASNAVIITPTSELAFQVADVIRSILSFVQTDPSTNPVSLTKKGRLDIKLAVISPPQNVHLLETGAASLTSDSSGAANEAATCTIFVGSAKQIHGSLTRSTGGLSPTPPPLVTEFYKNAGFVVLDEVDRLLLGKKKRGRGSVGGGGGGGRNPFEHEKGEHVHDKPAAVLAANIAKYRMGRVVVIGASATVGRNVRREFCRVLGLKYMDPLVVRKKSEQEDDEEEGEGEEDFEEEVETPEGRMVRIPDTVKHYFARFDGGGAGGGLAGAAQVTQKLSDSENRRILLVLTKNCGLNVKDALGALSFLNSKPGPITLGEARGERSEDSTFLAVTTEDMGWGEGFCFECDWL